jgi:O-antigen ligase
MGFFLSILYLTTFYLTPATIFGPLAEYRIQLVFAILITIVSIPSLQGASIWRTRQSLALVGIALAIFLSIFVGAHWFGGGLSALVAFIPNAFAFFLICLHCNSKRKLRIVVLMMLFVCLFVIGRGAMELHEGLPTIDDVHEADVPDSYFMGMTNDAGDRFYRLRGMGEIHDPNDFAQLIVCTIPLLFIFWRKKSILRNTFVIFIPVCVLLWGDYLTHSRGSILALLAVVIMAARRRIGTVPALVLAALLFSGASALHFAGGREISTTAGEDRTDLWGEGLQLLKSHPAFGVGFGNMPDYVGLTAHNTIVVCAAELGFFGLYFWSMFVLCSVRDSLVVASPAKVSEPTMSPPAKTSYPSSVGVVDDIDADEINRLGRIMILSFTGFLVGGWFLSRAYVVTLFLLGGMTEVIYETALQRGMVPPRMPMPKVLRQSGITAICLVVLMWIVLRVVHLTH